MAGESNQISLVVGAGGFISNELPFHESLSLTIVARYHREIFFLK